MMDPSFSGWGDFKLLIAGILTAGSLVAAVVFQLYFQSRSRWPPSPPALPILGHLHLVGAKPHIDLHRLALKYGPLFHIRMGLETHALVVSSARWAKEVLKVHDKAFASRPSHGSSVEIFSHGFQDIAGAPYGAHWRHMRALCQLELFTMKRIESFAHIRDNETRLLVQSILREESASEQPLKLITKVTQTILNAMSLMTMGKRLVQWGSCEESNAELEGFQETLNTIFHLGGLIDNIGDYFPSLRWLDLQGYERRMVKACKSFDGFIYKMIEHKRAQKAVETEEAESPKDLLDVLISLPNESKGKLSNDTVTAIMMDILSAGTDTSSSSVEWTFAELIRMPEKMKKLQQELDGVVGKERKVEETDLAGLAYLDAVVKETLRLHPPAPLLIPHESIEPCQLGPYSIPPKTRLTVSAWSIGRDPSAWEKPLDFYPERFLETVASSIDLRGKNFELIPFGSGRRMCPGMSLGLVMVKLTIARLLHSFDFSLPPGQKLEDVDMDERFGLTITKTEKLKLIPTPRSTAEFYQ